MTANRGLFVRNNGTAGTTPIEGRLVLASLVAENSPGVPRQGLLDQRATTVVSGAANMSYNIGPCTPVLNRATNEGVYMFTLTGTTNVVTDAAPGSGSRWDLIYVKQNDPDKGDSVNTATVGVHKGTAAASPTKPYATLPAGAYVLAEALVAAGATATNSAGVTITQVWRYTALRGAPIPVRNVTERNEISSLLPGTIVKRLDYGQNALQTWNGSRWLTGFGLRHAEFTGSTYPSQSTSWGTGPLTIDNNATFNNDGLFSSPSNDRINFAEPGLYAVHLRVKMSVTAQGQTWVRIASPDLVVEYASADIIPNTASAGTLAIPNLYIPTANTVLRIEWWSGTPGGYQLTSRVRVTKLAD